MLKRGQVSTFFIVGLIILAVVGGVVYVEWEYLNENWFSQMGLFQNVPEEVQPYYDSFMSCMEKNAETNLIYTAWRGGYYDDPKYINPYNHSYYFYGDKSLAPTKKFIEDQLAKAMDENYHTCLKSDLFPDLKIKVGEPKTTVTIADKAIAFNLEYPFEIETKGQTFNLKNFKYVMKVRYGEMVHSAQTIVKFQLADPDAICINCLMYAYDEYDLKTEYYVPEDGEAIFVLIAEDIILDEEPLRFSYAGGFPR